MDQRPNCLDAGDTRLSVRADGGACRRFARRFSALTRFLLVLSCSLVPAGAVHAAQWAQTYGGPGFDVAQSVYPTSDGGYVVAGYTDSFVPDTVAAWVFKLDAAGNAVWQKTYNGPLGASYATSVRSTGDGGYIVAGYLVIRAGEFDAWVLKLDANGDVTWQKTLGGTGQDLASTAQPTGDGGYVVVGYTGSFGPPRGGVWLLKLDAGGNVVRQQVYGVTASFGAADAGSTADGGYIVAGETSSFRPDRGDMWLLKLDAGGNVLWQKAYGNAFNGRATSVEPTADGGYIVAGTTVLPLTDFDAWVLKLDAAGNVVWQRAFGGKGIDLAFSVKPTVDGGYVVAGVTESFGAGDSDAWLLKLDASGNLVWQRTYGGAAGESAYSAQPTSDGGYVVAGTTASFGAGGIDAWVLKVDANGMIAGCAAIGASGAVPADTSAAVGNTAAAVAVSSASPESPAITQGNSTAVPKRQCYFAEPVIPVLSAWGTMLMSALLALGGAVAMHRGSAVRRANPRGRELQRVGVKNSV